MGLEEVYGKLISQTNVTAGDHKRVLDQMIELRKRYPRDTPARLLARARSLGAPIPPSRCNHHVPTGECVICNHKIGGRYYYTEGGTHIHSSPICESLARGQEKVRQRGGAVSNIYVLRYLPGEGDRRDPCMTCMKGTSRRGIS